MNHLASEVWLHHTHKDRIVFELVNVTYTGMSNKLGFYESCDLV